MQDVACVIVAGVWSLGRERQLQRVETRGECVLMFAVEDNEGKHFHFKGIVYWKSESDLNGEGSL